MDASTSRTKKNPSLTNVTRSIRHSPRLKLNTPKRSISSNLRTSQNVRRSTGPGAFVGKNSVLNADGKENSQNDESVVSELLTCESTTKKRNANVAYSESLVPERLHSLRKKQLISINESTKSNSLRSIRRSPRLKLNTPLKKPKRSITVNLSTSQKVSRKTGSGAFNGKNIGLNVDKKKSYNEDDESVAIRHLTIEPPTKERNLNDTYNKPLLREKRQSSKQKMTPIGKNGSVKYSAHPHFGRRTGAAAFEGKKIRLLSDGTENYEDYWTDEVSSEASCVTESSLAKSSIAFSSRALNKSNEHEKEILDKYCGTSKNARVDKTSSVSIESEKDTTVQHSHSAHHGPFSSELNMSKSLKKVNSTIGKHSLNELDANEMEPEKNAPRAIKEKCVIKDCGASKKARVTDTSSVTIESEKGITVQDNNSAHHGPISREFSKSKSPPNKVNQIIGKHSSNELNANEIVPEGNATGVRKRKRVNKISQEPLRRTARVPVPPLAFWHGERRKFRIVNHELLYVGINSGWKKDDKAFSDLARIIKNNIKNSNKINKLKKTNIKRVPKTAVLNPHTCEYVDVDLHRPFDSVQWSAVGGKDETKGPYYLTKTFSSEKVAFGFLNICPLEVKSSQYSPYDNIHFVVQKGRVKVTIHKTTFEFEKYDSFIVPSTVAYCIENLKKSNALLSFSAFKIPFFPYQCK